MAAKERETRENKIGSCKGDALVAQGHDAKARDLWEWLGLVNFEATAHPSLYCLGAVRLLSSVAWGCFEVTRSLSGIGKSFDLEY